MVRRAYSALAGCFTAVACIISGTLIAGLAPKPGPGLFVYDTNKLTQSEADFSTFVASYTSTGNPNSLKDKSGALSPWYIYLGGICTLYYSTPDCKAGKYCLKSGYSQGGKVLECGYAPSNKQVSYPPASVYDVAAVFKQGWEGGKPWITNMKLLLGIEFSPSVITQITKNSGIPPKGLFSDVLSNIPTADGFMFDVEDKALLSASGQAFMEYVSTELTASQYLTVYSASIGVAGVWNYWDAFNRTKGCGGGDQCQQGFWLQNAYDNTPVYYNINNDPSVGGHASYSFNASLLQYPYTLKSYARVPLMASTPKFYYQIALSPAGGASQSGAFMTNYKHTPVDAGGYRWGADNQTPATRKALAAKSGVDYQTSDALNQANCPKSLLDNAECQYFVQTVGGMTPTQVSSAYLCVSLAGMSYYYGGVSPSTINKASKEARRAGKPAGSMVGFGNASICQVPNTYGTENKWPIYYFNDQEFPNAGVAKSLVSDGSFMGPALFQLAPPKTLYNYCADKIGSQGFKPSSCYYVASPEQVTALTWKMFITWSKDWYLGAPKYPQLPVTNW